VRIWLIVFCVGAALVALHLTVSLITYHTIVDYPLVWAALSGVFFLSVAVGLLIGTPLANKVRAPELLFILCLLAGILVFVLSWATSPLEGALLKSAMGKYTRAVMFALVLTLPASIVLATVVPAAWRIHSFEKARRSGAGKGNPGPADTASLKWFFFVLCLGGTVGSFATLFVLPMPNVMHWRFLNGIGVLLAAIAFVGLSLHIRFIVTCIVAGHFFFASVWYQELLLDEGVLIASESVQSDDEEGDGDDFRKKKYMSYGEVRKVFGEMRAKIVAATDKSIGIMLVAEALEKLGNIAISGADFERVYSEMITDPEVLKQTIPFIKRIRLIESDGFGRIYFQIHRIKGSAEASLMVPQKDGYVKLHFKSHFTLVIDKKEDGQTRIAIGPRTEVESSFLHGGKSIYTPVTAVDAVGPIDVTLIYIDIFNKPDCVSIVLSCQGPIGGLKTREIAHLEK
jgi:hypothetical protein